MKVLLGLTGSVAGSLVPKLYSKLIERGHEVKIVVTEHGKYFVPKHFFVTEAKENFAVWYDDESEYPHGLSTGKYIEGEDPIPHIDLREWADVLLVCPASVNSVAKMANGICDNLLTSVFRAWDFTKPVYVAPAMNNLMFKHPITNSHLEILKKWNVKIIYPTVKKLACGEYGIGGLANLNDIIRIVEGNVWRNPFDCNNLNYLPLYPHPGSFGVVRHSCIHTGVDKYSKLLADVYAMEDGEIVSIGQFTGTKVGCPWWNDTWCVNIRGKSGTIVYGEILLRSSLFVGQKIIAGDHLGNVLEVVKESPKKFVEGHSRSMLHIELLSDDLIECPEWKIGEDRPKGILDPTPYLYLMKQ